MKISIFPKGELEELVDSPHQLAAWIHRAAELPVEGVELYSRFFRPGDTDAVHRAGEALVATGLLMPMLCASPDLAHPDADVRKQELEEEVRFVELAAHLGGPGASCRVLSGQRHPGTDPERGVAWVVEAIDALLPVARQHDVVLGFENHYKDGSWRYPEFAQSRERYLEILRRVPDREHFGVQFDPSNAVVAGDDPVELLREVVDRVVTMQASDRSLAPGASLADLATADGSAGYADVLRHGVLGEGVIDYPAVFGLLVEDGYDGWISIEDGVNGWDDMRRSVDFLRAAREAHFDGSAEVRHTRGRPVAGSARGGFL